MPVTCYPLARSLALHHYIIDARHDSLTNYRAGNNRMDREMLVFISCYQVSIRFIDVRLRISLPPQNNYPVSYEDYYIDQGHLLPLKRGSSVVPETGGKYSLFISLSAVLLTGR